MKLLTLKTFQSFDDVITSVCVYYIKQKGFLKSSWVYYWTHCFVFDKIKIMSQVTKSE